MEGCGRRRAAHSYSVFSASFFKSSPTPMAGGVGVGFVLGLLYASQRRRPVPATLYRVASKEVDAKGLADLALAEVV